MGGGLWGWPQDPTNDAAVDSSTACPGWEKGTQRSRATPGCATCWGGLGGRVLGPRVTAALQEIPQEPSCAHPSSPKPGPQNKPRTSYPSPNPFPTPSQSQRQQQPSPASSPTPNPRAMAACLCNPSPVPTPDAGFPVFILGLPPTPSSFPASSFPSACLGPTQSSPLPSSQTHPHLQPQPHLILSLLPVPAPAVAPPPRASLDQHIQTPAARQLASCPWGWGGLAEQ